MKRFLLWYLGSFIFSCFLLIGLMFFYGLSSEEVKAYYFIALSELSEQWIFWGFLTFPYLLFRLGRYLVRSYKNHGKLTFLKRSTFSIVLPVGLIFSLFSFSEWYTNREKFEYKWDSAIENKSDRVQEYKEDIEKHRGAHVFGRIDSSNIKPFIRNNYDWITMVSFGDQKDYDSPIMTFNRGDSLQRIKRDSSWKKQIDIAHDAGFKVFIKPHIWLNSASGGKWRSDIYPASDDNWELWTKNYREFILFYADIAQKNKVEMFCIGTELSRLSTEKPAFWKSLIQEVRSVYSGKITYAANWYKEYDKITFWDQLDYIGVQAYFPLVKNKYPSVEQISKGWKRHLSDLESIHEKFQKDILFTEMGYKSTPDSAIKPWEWVEYSDNLVKPVSTETQANCYEAFFNTVWDKDWFVGVHIWQLRSDNRGRAGRKNLDFTPQGKPAENIIAKGFKKI